VRFRSSRGRRIRCAPRSLLCPTIIKAGDSQVPQMAWSKTRRGLNHWRRKPSSASEEFDLTQEELADDWEKDRCR
jgi:hypothetical protein